MMKRLLLWLSPPKRIKRIQMNGCMAHVEKLLFDGFIERMDYANDAGGGDPIPMYVCRDAEGKIAWMPIAETQYSDEHKCLVYFC